MKSIALSVLAALAFWGAGCSNEGPAEKAGKQIDEAVEDTSDAVGDAADAVEDSADETAKKAKQAVE